ncbi:MAG: triacylglycerol lipase [Thermoleophilaceae bacterium]|jgi:pimeloyl-ACP methyl ester carboxylesterase|nr:triacylglycerol lipase [Thermoleophilaceae bacterium]
MRPPILSSLGVRPPLWREARIGLEAAALVRDPLFRGDGLVDGRGRPVLLIPGFLAGDGSLSMMAGWLKRSGYKPSRAGIVSNVNCAGVLMPRLEQRLERLVALQGQRAAIVGQSRGGTLAKVLASRRPDLVSGVVALGSPQVDPLAVHPLVRLQVEAVSRLGSLGAPGLFKRSCLDGECCSSFWEDLAQPPPPGVQLVSVYSKSDGVVDWRSCLDPHATELVEIRASHCGMAVSRSAWRAVADALDSFREAEPRRRPAAGASVHRLPRAA